jgi:hypothetical protein
MHLTEKGKCLSYYINPVGKLLPEFRSEAIQALKSTLENDKAFYTYHGSLTTPPCTEEVLHIVFKKARSINTAQFKYLRSQIVKMNDGSPFDEAKAESMYDVYGNKRNIQEYNVNERGFIDFNRYGLLNSDEYSAKKQQLNIN